jgi:hypothetical protein
MAVVAADILHALAGELFDQGRVLHQAHQLLID